MSVPFLEIEGLVKRFGPFTAVAGLSFRVEKGEVLGFLGPNGAGKSTTMRMITGALAPTEGRVRILGHDVAEERLEAQGLIGYLPEGAPAYPDMTPEQFLRFAAETRGLKAGLAERAVGNAVARTQLASVLDRPIETLSKGFKRRVGLAQAILHNPPVLIMDEPTDGLDPNQKFAVRRLIDGMAKEKAIIISTHILEEVEAVCTRALIIDQGRIVADGTPADLAGRSRAFGGVTVRLASAHAEGARSVFQELEAVRQIRERWIAGHTVEITLLPTDPGYPLVEEIGNVVMSSDWEVSAIFSEQGRLDDVFRDLTTPDALSKGGEEGPDTAAPDAKPAEAPAP